VRNASSALPAAYVLLDTETTPTQVGEGTVEHRLRLGVALYVQVAGTKRVAKDQRLHFTRPDDVWAWVERKVVTGRRLVLVAHNAGFDLQVLGGPDALAARGWRIRKAVIDDGRLILLAEKGGGSLLVLDFGNYFPVPLDQIGELLGIDKLPLPAEDAPDAEWWRRCDVDVDILRLAFERWLALVRDHDLGHFAETLPKQAMNGYRHRFMGERTIVAGELRAAELERASYYGGRVEAFRVGQLTDGPWHKLDAHSFYGAVMHDELFPTKLRWRVVGMRREGLAAALDKYLLISRVRIETDEPLYPVRVDGRLVFPVGQFRTTLCTPELRMAFERGHLRAVGDTAIYDRAPLFTDWVDAIYGIRQSAWAQGDRFTAELAKRLLTSLFGRFGMRVSRWEHAGDEPGGIDEVYKVWNADAHAQMTFRRLGGRLERKTQEQQSDQAMVAIPAHVTSYGRVRLARWIETAGRDHVAYTGVDSLIVDDQGLFSLAADVDPVALGKLGLEGSSDDVFVGGPNMYRFGALARHKGVRGDAEPTDVPKVEQDEWVSFRRSLDLGHDGGPLVRTIERTVSDGTIAGPVTPAGAVLPLRLGLEG